MEHAEIVFVNRNQFAKKLMEIAEQCPHGQLAVQVFLWLCVCTGIGSIPSTEELAAFFGIHPSDAKEIIGWMAANNHTTINGKVA